MRYNSADIYVCQLIEYLVQTKLSAYAVVKSQMIETLVRNGATSRPF